MAERIHHPLPIWGDEEARVLLLGSFPSPRSRERAMYYGNPQNRFWRVLAALFEDEVPADPAAAQAFCLRHHLALSDVLASCRIDGASDSSIRDAVPMDFDAYLESHAIRKIICTGATAAKLYRRHLEPHLGRPCLALPSTSPANARYRLDDLIEAYRPLVALTRPAPFTPGPSLFTTRLSAGEGITVLYEDEVLRIEQIESHHAASPAQGYYDQAEDEWVSVLEGQAILGDPDGGEVLLRAGDQLFLPAHTLHRVEATSERCIWLCVFRKKTSEKLT